METVVKEEVSIVLVFEKNKTLVKTKDGWRFYIPVILSPREVIDVLMEEEGLAKNIEVFYNILNQLGIPFLAIFKSNPVSISILIDILCKRAIEEIRNERGDDFEKYRKYMDYLNEFDRELSDVKTRIPVARYKKVITNNIQRAIHIISQAIPESNHYGV